MTNEEIYGIINKQKLFYETGATLDVSKRKAYLKALYKSIKLHEAEICDALYKDLGKSPSESYMCEIGTTLSEISYLIKKIKKLAKPQRAVTPISEFLAKSYTIAHPYGNVLVMSPWNYPVLLSLDPLAEAIAAGNTVLLKTSEYSTNTNTIVKKIVDEVFPEELCAVVFGGYDENTFLIHSKFDYIFFTGSKRVGSIVYQNAAANNIPVTLELGGKSPCIIDSKVNLKRACKRIVWAKFLNVGQTCVAPDYFFVHKDIKEAFIKGIIKEINRQFPDPLNSKTYGHIVTEHHFERVMGLIDINKVIYGGGYNREALKIEPTIMDNVTFDDKVMKEEIFGPIMPIIEYDDLSEVVGYVNNHDAPLAFYIYSNNKKNISYAITHAGFGGGCINECIMHLATSFLPFGGYKHSGMGQYHGKYGFNTFSHTKAIVNKANIIDLPLRYQPYTKSKDFLVKKFLK